MPPTRYFKHRIILYLKPKKRKQTKPELNKVKDLEAKIKWLEKENEILRMKAIKQMDKNVFDLVIAEIKQIRKRISGIGSGKLYELIKPFFFSRQLKIGRGKLHQLMKKESLLVKRKHYKVVTTQSDHNYKKYPNRVKDFIPMGTKQLWESDHDLYSGGSWFCVFIVDYGCFFSENCGLGFTTHFEGKRSRGGFENGFANS